MDVAVTLNDVKRVVAKHMVLMFANSKLQPAIVVSKKAIFVQYARARLPESSFQRRSNNSRDMTVNSCELNQEEDGDDSSFQMYENSTNSKDGEGFGLYRTGTDSMTVKPYVVSVQLGNATVNMEVDTGASRSTVSQYVYNTLLTDFPLQNTDVTLRSYSGEKVPILGKISVPVKYSSKNKIQKIK